MVQYETFFWLSLHPSPPGFSMSKIDINKNRKINNNNFLVIQGTLSPSGPNFENIVIIHHHHHHHFV